MAVLVSDKADFKPKTIKRAEEGHCIIKGSILQKDTKIENIYAPNIRAPQYIKQTLTDLKEEIDFNTIILEDFSTPPSTMDRSFRQKTNK